MRLLQPISHTEGHRGAGPGWSCCAELSFPGSLGILYRTCSCLCWVLLQRPHFRLRETCKPKVRYKLSRNAGVPEVLELRVLAPGAGRGV